MTEKTEAELTEQGVDVHAWGPTEDDEEQVLADLGYVLNSENGIYEDPA